MYFCRSNARATSPPSVFPALPQIWPLPIQARMRPPAWQSDLAGEHALYVVGVFRVLDLNPFPAASNADRKAASTGDITGVEPILRAAVVTAEGLALELIRREVRHEYSVGGDRRQPLRSPGLVD